ncbi:hypothetical protein ALO86_200194 [Pseudomonas syringae pv. berberidis]|nr:hypothetical protein ALO86_200194 [Pseudomonas syringae pv. berberidis]
MFRFRHCVISRQALFTRCVLPGDHYGVLDVHDLPQLHLDLAQLDTKASYLDLIVIAPQVLDVAVRQPAAQIAAPVHPRCRLGTERVLDETLRRQFRQIQIATGNPRTADMDLAADPDGYRLALGIQQVNPCIADGATNGNRARIVGQRMDFVGAGKCRCFRWPIAIDQMPGPMGAGQNLRNVHWIEHIPTDQEVSQL